MRFGAVQLVLLVLVTLAIINGLEFSASSINQRSPPSFLVNLDQPPDVRWTHVVSHYQQFVPELEELVKQVVPFAFLRRIIEFFVERLEALLPDEMLSELKGISRHTGIKLADLAVINLLYDIIAFNRETLIILRPQSKPKACTTIICQDQVGHILHGRNMDFTFQNLLANLTVIVDFQRQNQTIYSGVTYVFFVGLFTGQRADAFSLSLNERYSGSLLENIYYAIITRLKHPVAFSLRKALELQPTYAAAVTHLSNVHIIAPCFLIVGGIKPNEGCVITRDRGGAADVWNLSVPDDRWYLLETNFDHWKPAGDERRRVGQRAMNSTGQANINERSLYAILSLPPIMND